MHYSANPTQCHRITKGSNTNFYYSFLSLPSEKRKAIYSIYALCRRLDDVVDKSDSKLEASENLLKWTTDIINMYEGRPSHPVTVELKPYIERYSIPRKYFFELIKGVEMDLIKNRYGTFDELHKYCYRVASAVGLICAEVFGYRNAETLGYAVDLGIAMQLTNILRDIKADAAKGRIYLPLEDLRKFGYTEAELLSSTYNPTFIEVMQFECQRAWGYYKRAQETLPKEDRKAMIAAEIMRAIYSRLLQKIEAAKYDVFSLPIQLTKTQKLYIAFRTWLENKLGA
ncbi:MAG: presqualene diphosphate synthase HpnD [Nitrospirae bacterium]|nr:presqualene diphosphate synthase HpnD [Nitrospirota bacterium]